MKWAVVVALAACIEQVPPPARPELVVPHPAVALGPPAAGEGVVLIDTVGGQADVHDEGGRVICATPCEVHLPQGFHSLSFTDPGTFDQRGDGRITVGAVPTAYRYALGHKPQFTGAHILATILSLSGGSVLLTGALVESAPIIGIGTGLLALGIAGFYLLRPTNQPGVGVQWTPQRDAPP